jgi:hypothetical protein
MKLNACGVFWVIHVTHHRSGWLHGGLLTVGLKAVETAEILPDGDRVAAVAYRAIFYRWSRRGASSEAAVAPEVGPRARIGFGDEFVLPSGPGLFLQHGVRYRHSR